MEAKTDTAKTPIKICLNKARNYNWEISIAGTNVDGILATIKDADTKLRSEYGNANAEA